MDKYTRWKVVVMAGNSRAQPMFYIDEREKEKKTRKLNNNEK